MPLRFRMPRFRMPHRLLLPCRLFLSILTVTLLSGCTIVKVADVAASSAIGITVGTAKMTGKAIGAAIPDGDKEDDD